MWKKQANNIGLGLLLRLAGTLMTPADLALLVGAPLTIFLFLWETHSQRKLVLKSHGLFRFPASLIVSAFGVLGTSLLYAKVNPYVRDIPHPAQRSPDADVTLGHLLVPKWRLFLLLVTCIRPQLCSTRGYCSVHARLASIDRGSGRALPPLVDHNGDRPQGPIE